MLSWSVLHWPVKAMRARCGDCVYSMPCVRVKRGGGRCCQARCLRSLACVLLSSIFSYPPLPLLPCLSCLTPPSLHPYSSLLSYVLSYV